MARRKRVYSKRRRINYKRVALLIAAFVVLVLLILKIFNRNSYISKVEDVLNSEITRIEGSISIVSKVDATIYEKDGIKYTNQHENIKRLITFDGSLPEDADKVGDVKVLLENLLKSEKTEKTEKTEGTEAVIELPPKNDGYYWIEADIFIKEKSFIFTKENEYNFDLYYDIENETIYVKEKYYDEFNKKFNKVKFQGYKATDEFRNIVNRMGNT